MARLVKEWMKAKKGICSSDCECLTITGWRCYAEEHLCNCGDGGSNPPVPSTYTVTITTNDATYGTVDVSTVEVEGGTSISASNNVLTVGTTNITATAETGHRFEEWTVNGGALPSTVNANITVVANFAVYVPVQSISDPDISGDVSLGAYGRQDTVHFTFTPTNATNVSEAVTFNIEYPNVVSAYISDYAQDGTATITLTPGEYGYTSVEYSLNGADNDYHNFYVSVNNYTYGLIKTVTRGRSVLYTANRREEDMEMGEYILKVNYDDQDAITSAEIMDNGSSTMTENISDLSIVPSYVQMAEDALTVGTQPAYAQVYYSFEDLFNSL